MVIIQKITVRLFLGELANLQKKKTKIKFKYVCLSVLRMEQLGSHWADFHEI